MTHSLHSPREDLEREIIRYFVLAARRERMVFLQARRRNEFVKSFHTEKFLDLSAAKRVNLSTDIYASMKQLGASDECYALSAQKDLDARMLSLKDALKFCVGASIETVLVSPGTGIGYYEGGGYTNRYILVCHNSSANPPFERTPYGTVRRR